MTASHHSVRLPVFTSLGYTSRKHQKEVLSLDEHQRQCAHQNHQNVPWAPTQFQANSLSHHVIKHPALSLYLYLDTLYYTAINISHNTGLLKRIQGGRKEMMCWETQINVAGWSMSGFFILIETCMETGSGGGGRFWVCCFKTKVFLIF